MNHRQREEWRRMRREARRARRGGWGGDEPEEDEPPPDPKRPLTPEEKALREARAEANRKIGFIAHLIPYLAVASSCW